MSGITKLNKDQLSTLASDLTTQNGTFSGIASSLSSTLNGIESHDEFHSVTSKSSLISESITDIDKDLKLLSANINSYLETLIKIDSEGFDVNDKTEDTDKSTVQNNISIPVVQNPTSSNISTGVQDLVYRPSYSYSSTPSGTIIHTSTNNSNNNSSTSMFPSSNLTGEDTNVPAGGKYNYEGIEKYLENEKGITVEVPEGLGNVHTYMGWQCITAVSSNQYKLRTAAGMNFDEEGFAKIGDRYVIACTTTFGNVGDFIDVYQKDGTVLKCVIGDIKNQNDAGCTKWGHNNGDCIIEFVVDKNKWYSGDRGNHVNPGTSNCHPEWNQDIEKIVNKGNFFDLIKTDAAKFDSENVLNSLEKQTLYEI